MNWLILTGVMILLVSLGVVLEVKLDSDILAPLMMVVGTFGCLTAVTVYAYGTISTPKEVNAFFQQKEYIETHQASDPVEDAALTGKKLELNKWLYNAQYSKRRFGGWSFYTDDIFDMEPIE